MTHRKGSAAGAEVGRVELLRELGPGRGGRGPARRSVARPGRCIVHIPRRLGGSMMRRLVCVVAASVGLLMGCGDAAAMDSPDTLGTVEQALACRYPDMSCPSGSVCVDELLCRTACPSSGTCASGLPCRISQGGTRYCNY